MNTQLIGFEETQLKEYEIVIERGLNAFMDVGEALLAIRDRRLYRNTHPTFEDYCQHRWGMERRHAYRLIEAAQTVENVSHGTHLPPPQNERQARPLTALDPEDQVSVWRTAVETAPDGNITARHVQEVVDHHIESKNSGNGRVGETGDLLSPENGNGGVSASPDYDGNEWYTPVEYLDLARQLMGAIDVDPASCDWAQDRVKATVYYTKDTDGLSRDWPGSVWLNPPYSFPEVEQFTAKLQQQYEQGITTEAVLLVNNCTDSDWFQQLLQLFPVCFTNGRIKFERPGVDKFATRQGQAFFYLGTDVLGFADIFGAVGTVLTLMKVYA